MAVLEPVVTLYQDDNFRGSSWTLNGVGDCAYDGNCAIGTSPPNDAISSMQVQGPPGTRVTVYTSCPADADAGSSAVRNHCITHNDVGHTLGPGRYTAAQMGIPDNSLSYVRVQMPIVTLYADGDFQGVSWTYHGIGDCSYDGHCAIGTSPSNDMVSSMTVEGPTDTRVTVYASCPTDADAGSSADKNYCITHGDVGHTLGPGRYDAAQMGIPDNSLSYVRVQYDAAEASHLVAMHQPVDQTVAVWGVVAMFFGMMLALFAKKRKNHVSGQQVSDGDPEAPFMKLAEAR